MNLQQKLDAQKKKMEASAPREALDIMHRATEDLTQSGIIDRIVKKGDKAPITPSGPILHIPLMCSKKL